MKYNLAALKAGKHVYGEAAGDDVWSRAGSLFRFAKEKGLLIGCAPDTFLGGRLQNIRERSTAADWAASRAAARGLSVMVTSSIIRLRHSSISRVRVRCTIWGRTTSPRCSACSAR